MAEDSDVPTTGVPKGQESLNNKAKSLGLKYRGEDGGGFAHWAKCLLCTPGHDLIPGTHAKVAGEN